MATRYYAPFPDRDGEPYRQVPRHVLRIGDAERDAAAADLGDHYVAGRLTLDELHDRLGEVFAARTHGQLGKVMADLPGSAWPQQLAHAADEAVHLMTPHMVTPHMVSPHLVTPEPVSPADETGRGTTAADRAGRFAALSLLVLAMLIWLFTAYLFARHGAYVHSTPTPWTSPHHFHPGG